MCCSALLDAVRFAKRVILQGGPPLTLYAMNEQIVSHFTCAETSDSWFKRVITGIDHSCDETFTSEKEFKDWVSRTRIQDVSYKVTMRCAECCFPKPQEQSQGYQHYSCFRAMTSDYVGIHHLVRKRSQITRKALLILSGSWRWSKPFIKWKDEFEHCKACVGLPDLDLPHLVASCRATDQVRAEFISTYGESPTADSCAADLGSKEGSDRVATFFGAIYEALLRYYNAAT
jgi:hypothetical protein